MAESNTYVFAHDSTQKRDPSLVALRMQDKTPVHGGLGLRKDSGWQLNSIFQPLIGPEVPFEKYARIHSLPILDVWAVFRPFSLIK